MKICGRTYNDIEFTSKTIIRLGDAACPWLDSVFAGAEFSIEDARTLATAYAALVMGVSPSLAAMRLRSAGDSEIASVARQFAKIIDRSPLLNEKKGSKKENHVDT